MSALEEAQRYLNFTGFERHEANVEMALGTMAYAAIAQAEATERVATQLGNIHKALMTPNVEREPVTVADLLMRQAVALEKIVAALCMGNDLTVLDGIYAMVEAVSNRP